MKHKELRKFLVGMAFVGPNFLGFILLILFPVLFSFVLVLFEWNILRGFEGLRFVGLDNFRELVHDTRVGASLKNNAVFTLVTIPVKMMIALLLAVILDRYAFMRNGLKTAFFFPYITNVAAACAIWAMLFQPTYGPINGFLRSIGIDQPPGWLSSGDWALPTIMGLHIWMSIGYNMIIYLAGLQQIPSEMREAAMIDGASGFQVFRKVTVPLLSPTTFFLLVTNLIGSFKIFAPINILTEGGPGTSTSVLVYEIYISAFQFFKMGYASVIAWVLFVIVFIITCVQWMGQKKWVNYM